MRSCCRAPSLHGRPVRPARATGDRPALAALAQPGRRPVSFPASTRGSGKLAPGMSLSSPSIRRAQNQSQRARVPVAALSLTPAWGLRRPSPLPCSGQEAGRLEQALQMGPGVAQPAEGGVEGVTCLVDLCAGPVPPVWATSCPC